MIETLTMEQAASKLHISRRTLQDLIKTRPYYKLAGRRKIFSARDMRNLCEALQCPSPLSNATAQEPGTCAVPSEESLWHHPMTKLGIIITLAITAALLIGLKLYLEFPPEQFMEELW